MNKKVLVKHLTCRHKWETAAGNLIEGHGCPKCAGNLMPNTKEYKRRVKEIWGEEFTVLGDYTGANRRILIRHEICGHEFMPFASNLTNGEQGCPKCRPEVIGDALRKDHGTFVKEVYNLVGDEYTVLGEYRTTHGNILIKHKECGFEWKVQPAHFLSGTRCPRCQTKSKAEDETYEILDKNDINFEHHITFDDCRNQLPLPFDFGVYKNNSLILIELDGIQHFKPVEYWGGEKKLEYIQQNDKIKDEYCFKNNIPLIRIPYWEFDNIEKILEKELAS